MTHKCHSSVTQVPHQRVQTLPPALGLCTSLVELTCGHNSLTALPNELGLCEALCTVAVHDNALTQLGEGVPTLPALRLLDVRNNDLQSLPPALGSCTALRAVPMTGNPLRSIPRAVREGASWSAAFAIQMWQCMVYATPTCVHFVGKHCLTMCTHIACSADCWQLLQSGITWLRQTICCDHVCCPESG